MSNVTLENENAAPAKVEATKKPAKRKAAKKAKPPKKVAPAKKNVKKPASERTNKKADVIAMMKRAGGATLEAIMHATGWQRPPSEVSSASSAARAAIFGRSAFDLARRVRRATYQVDMTALSRLLSSAEKLRLGIR